MHLLSIIREPMTKTLQCHELRNYSCVPVAYVLSRCRHMLCCLRLSFSRELVSAEFASERDPTSMPLADFVQSSQVACFVLMNLVTAIIVENAVMNSQKDEDQAH